MSSPALKVLLEEWACASSVVETLLAVPPSAVEFTYPVKVQVPVLLFVVMLVIVPA